MPYLFVRYRVLLAALILLPLASGCAAAGYAAYVAQSAQTEDAAYKGLANQKCAVMVWADNGVLDDYKSIQLDTAKGLQLKLEAAAKANLKEAQNITWVSPEQILQYQQNHPDMDSEDITTIAPKFGVSRLIYISVDKFQTHPDDSPDLARGNMRAAVKVVEIEHGKGVVKYADEHVEIVAPDKCPVEGLPNLEDDAVYKATIDTFTSETAKRFVPHELDAES